ncbi:Multidrug export protein EmrA [Aquisphaera giovannonii]|uniref:Multidrug export protein EmrA n=1 Tax=Aquisphaera giovannonii TaxID=406548 RepID=A0A5B9WF17_9BACT|nr:HlyD family secretion protein [Aquisphaera giovannonii]QEH39137.1 Multidrug export protein EmrA [Aquisphaera giovannonii]
MDTERRNEPGPPPGDAPDRPAPRATEETPGDPARGPAAPEAPPPHPPSGPRRRGKRLLIGLLLAAGLAGGAAWYRPALVLMWNSVHTDDAYVAGHVTYVAPRVAGTILKVHVDDNEFVEQGDLLAELDPELYRVAEARAAAAVAVAEAQLVQARSQAKSIVAGIRASFNNLMLTTNNVTEGIAKLKASLATQAKAAAQRSLAEAELRRARNLLQSSSGTQQVVDQREASFQVAAATEVEALEQAHLARAAIGLPSIPPPGQGLGDVPADWANRAPAVRAALAELINVAVKIGADVPPIEEDARTAVENFRRKAPGGDLDAYLNNLADDSPPVRLAKAGVEQASRALDQARLDLRDTKIRAEFSGVIGRRVANPGNRVQAGQGLMTLRSLDDVWIDANFKETQLADLRIGQPVEIHADAYPGRTYRGRVSGFAPGTGAATALLPPENATGNFVKVVQRLPVRIDLVDGNPPDAPLFVGLSVEPRVLIREAPAGPFAGQRLRRPVQEEAGARAAEPSR